MNSKKEKIRKQNIQSWMDLAYGDPEQVTEITLPVLSGSMAPLLLPGDEIVIKHTALHECRIGDIIVFRGIKGLTAHRMLLHITLFDSTFVFQKGDSNRFGNWISSNRIVGLVTESRNKSGMLTSFITENGRIKARNTAIKHIFRDFIQRLVFIPGKLLPNRLKAGIKKVFHITKERHASGIQ